MDTKDDEVAHNGVTEEEAKEETKNDVKPPETVAAPVHKDDTSVIDSLRTEVAELRGIVDTLVNQTNRDEVPSSRPWTHRGGRH